MEISMHDLSHNFDKYIRPFIDAAKSDADYFDRISAISDLSDVPVDVIDEYHSGDRIHYHLNQNEDVREYAEFIMKLKNQTPEEIIKEFEEIVYFY